MGSSTWYRQYEVTLTKNAKLLLRRPFHLAILLLSSVISVIFAWLAGRDARGPTGEFPPLDNCGNVDPFYYFNVSQAGGYEATDNIPLSLNEPWRGGLPLWLMSLGPTFAAISVFWILRDELNSSRWGVLRSAGLRDSCHWMAWFTAFAVLATVNSLLGGIAAKTLPNAHALTAVNYASVFGSLLFLNTALTTASFFLAAICGTCQSTALSVFIVMGILVASGAPAIAASIGASSVGAGGGWVGGGGAGSFWAYMSTESTSVWYESGYIYNETTGEYEYVEASDPTVRSYQSPIISYEESRVFGFEEENLERYSSREDFFLGCYVKPGLSTQFNNPAWTSFFWFFVPQAHFMAAWSNILGYTSMPGNTFGFGQASQSPEFLATEALLNYRGGVVPLYDASNTNGTSLFPQGSTVLTEWYYPVTILCEYLPDDPYRCVYKSNCPPAQLYDAGSSYLSESCVNAAKGYPTGGNGSPSFNDAVGYLFAVTLVYSILAAYLSSVFPMGNGSPMKFYFPLLPSYWLGRSKKGSEEGDDGAAVDEEVGLGAVTDRDVGVKAINVSKKYGKLEALKPLNLSMRKGEVTGKSLVTAHHEFACTFIHSLNLSVYLILLQLSLATMGRANPRLAIFCAVNRIPLVGM